MLTASAWRLPMTPASKTMTASAAPKAAAWEMPRVKGEPRGFLSTDCMTTPAADRPKPASTAARAWGRRMFRTMRPMRGLSARPRSADTTSPSGTRTAPTDRARAPSTRSAASIPATASRRRLTWAR